MPTPRPATPLDGRSATHRTDQRSNRHPSRPPTEPRSLLVRLAGPISAPGRAPAPRTGSAPADAVLTYARTQRDQVRDLEPAVRRDEPDAVHRMRVATRRLRSTLRTFRPLFEPHRAAAVRAELRWLGEVLGAARDREVLAAHLEAACAAEPPELVLGPVANRIRQRLAAEAATARTALEEALDSGRYRALLDALDQLLAEAVQADRLRGKSGGRAVLRRARKALRRADQRMVAARQAPPEGAPANAPALVGVLDRDTALHEARKAVKRARYAAEAVRGDGGKSARGAKRLAKRLSAVQDTLGDHHDTVVTRQVLRDYGVRAHLDGENAFSYGLLHARQAAHAATLEAQLPERWRAARRPKVRRWLG